MVDISKYYKSNDIRHENIIVPIDRLRPNELNMRKIVQRKVVIFACFPLPMSVGGIVV